MQTPSLPVQSYSVLLETARKAAIEGQYHGELPEEPDVRQIDSDLKVITRRLEELIRILKQEDLAKRKATVPEFREWAETLKWYFRLFC